MLINILGAERTGSTLLDVMLGNGAETFSCGEASFHFRPMRKHDFILDCSCGIENCEVWKEMGSWQEKQFHSKLLSRYRFVIDSSKNLVWVIDSTENLNGKYPALNLVTWKPAKEILYSHWKRGNDLLTAYKKYIKYYDQLLSCRIPFLSVNHQDLTTKPSAVLKQICLITGMEFFDGKEKFWEQKDHHFLFGSHGIRQQVRAGESKIYDEVKDEAYDVFFDKNKEQILDVKGSEQILTKIQERSIFKFHNIPPRQKIVKPIWYYYKKTGRWVLKHFPKSYEIKDVNPIYGKQK